MHHTLRELLSGNTSLDKLKALHADFSDAVQMGAEQITRMTQIMKEQKEKLASGMLDWKTANRLRDSLRASRKMMNDWIAHVTLNQTRAYEVGKAIADRTGSTPMTDTTDRIYGHVARAINWVAENPWTVGGVGAGIIAAGALAYYLWRKGDKKAAQKVLEADIKATKSETMNSLKHISVSVDENDADVRRFINAAKKSQSSMAKAKALTSKLGKSRSTTEDFERAAKQVQTAKRDAGLVVKTATASQASLLKYNSSRSGRSGKTTSASVRGTKPACAFKSERR